jgi:hypothetical protein
LDIKDAALPRSIGVPLSSHVSFAQACPEQKDEGTEIFARTLSNLLAVFNPVTMTMQMWHL